MEKKYNKYTLEDKAKLAEVVEKYKSLYDEEVAEKAKLKKQWDPKRKLFVQPTVQWGYLTRSVKEVFPYLQPLSSNDDRVLKAVAVARRAYESRKRKLDAGDMEMSGSAGTSKKFRSAGGGRKAKAQEVREAAFEWFVDIRGTLKGRLPVAVFKAKCMELYQRYLDSQVEEIKEEERLQFSNHWVQDWMREYNVSLLKPNKRFSISHDERKLRIVEFIKNVLRVRHFFLSHFKKEPVIINGDQMPLHRNESSTEKTMTLKNQPVYVKENHMLSRERVTVYTQLSTDSEEKKPTPEILFKGKGKRIKVNPPKGMNVQFAVKGSYRLENMLEMVKQLKNRHNLFSQKDYALYILDDYSVHLLPELRASLLKKGYVLVVIGGGITGDVQVNDTHLHHQLKGKYRGKETALMLQKLEAEPNKIPSPTRDDMMDMLLASWESVKLDPVLALKNNFLLNAMDGSEDYLVTDKLMDLVGEEIIAFRTNLVSSTPPKSIRELVSSITPPKGVRVKKAPVDDAPLDEGMELIDCEGDEIPAEEMDNTLGEDDDQSNSRPAGPVEETTLTEDAIPSVSTVSTIGHLPTDTANDDTNADCAFINDIQSELEKHSGKTSTLFLPYLCQIKDNVAEARRNLKKRVMHLDEKTEDN